jgi:rubrerythrin
MLEQAMLRDQFQALLVQEQQAEKIYAELVARLTDPELLQQVQQLHRDKQRHIRLTERLLEILE